MEESPSGAGSHKRTRPVEAAGAADAQTRPPRLGKHCAFSPSFHRALPHHKHTQRKTRKSTGHWASWSPFSQFRTHMNFRRAVFLCSKYALPQILSKDSGVIINISSALARAPYPGLAAYSASKAGVVAFTKALGGEIDGTRLKIWAVCPAATNTPMLQRVIGAEEARSAMKPERVAKICLDLIVGKNDLASGEAVFVDNEPVSHRVKRRIRKIVAEFS